MVLLSVLTGLSVRADAASTHVLGAKTQTLAPAANTMNAGFYSATTLETVDADLAAENIKGGVNIFGKLGTAANSRALPDTGQTVHYSTAAGDDSDYKPATTQPSYTDNADGTTTDNRTGLMWAKDGSAAGCNGGVTAIWEDAITACEDLTFAAYDDWRLPNIKDLQSIVDYSRQSPSINPTYFLNTQSFYWSSTSYVPNSANSAWGVAFTNGFINTGGKASIYSVRCVRGGF